MENHNRENLRQRDQKDFDFQLDMGFVPEHFIRRDIPDDDRWHLVFATDRQLQLLGIAKHWEIDATFKIIRPPFIQLLYIHAFIRHEDLIQHVPLVCVMMSGKRKVDYIAFLKAIEEAE